MNQSNRLKGLNNAIELNHVERYVFNFDDLLRESFESGDYIGETIEEKLIPIASKYAEKHVAFIAYILREIIRNVPEHSECNSCTLDVFSNNSGQIGFRVTDRGIGIMNSLKKNSLYSQIEDNFSFVALSLKPGVTKTTKHDISIPKEWRNSGFGLFMTSKLVKEMGRFELVSKNDGLVLKDVFIEKIKNSYKSMSAGTIVTLVIDLEKVPATKKRIAHYSKLGNKMIMNSSKFSEYAYYDTASKASTLISDGEDL